MRKQTEAQLNKAYRDAAMSAVEDASPLNADDLSDGIIITEEAFDALRAAIAETKH